MRLMLKKMREAYGITQQEAADALGVKVATYRTWEQGSVKITLENACRCAEALACSPNDICGWYLEHPICSEPAADPAQSQLLHAYDSLNEEGREVAVNVVSGLAGTYPQEPPEVQAESA